MRLLKEIRTLLANYKVKSGIYHYYRNEFKQAADFLRKALAEEPPLTESERETALYYLTQTFVHSAERRRRDGDEAAAIEDLRRGVEVSPSYPDIRFRLGRALERAGRADEAVEQYRQALEHHPDYLEAQTSLAFCLLGQERLAEAEQAFARAVELKIQRVQRPFEEGRRRLGQSDLEGARSDFENALRSSPEQFEEHYRAALESLRLEEYDRALAELDLALEINPRYADLLNYRGVALVESDRLEEGIEAFREAIRLNPDYIVPRLNLAFGLLRSGQIKEAETQLEVVLEKDPTQHAAVVQRDELRRGRRSASRGGGGAG